MCFLEDTIPRRSDKLSVIYGLFTLMDAHAEVSVPVSHEMGKSISQVLCRLGEITSFFVLGSQTSSSSEHDEVKGYG